MRLIVFLFPIHQRNNNNNKLLIMISLVDKKKRTNSGSRSVNVFPPRNLEKTKPMNTLSI